MQTEIVIVNPEDVENFNTKYTAVVTGAEVVKSDNGNVLIIRMRVTSDCQ